MTGGTTIHWADKVTETLRGLWPEGKSASEIAKILNLQFGLTLTRSSIIGKAHRLSLPRRGDTRMISRAPRPGNGVRTLSVHRTPAQKAAAVAAAKSKPAPALPVVLVPLEPMVQPDGSVMSLLSLTKRSCRAPIGDPHEPGFAFCGREATNGSYCSGHAARFTVTAEKRVRRAPQFATAGRGISY